MASSQQEGPGFELTGPSCKQTNYRSDKKISEQSKPHKLRKTLKSIRTFFFDEFGKTSRWPLKICTCPSNAIF